MTNIVMLCHERLRLTEQALESLYAHTPADQFTLVLCDDGSRDFRVKRMLADYARAKSNCSLITLENSQHVLARAKNIGVAWSEQEFDQGDWLYLSDSDVWFAPRWLESLLAEAVPSEPVNFRLWGGQIHPFHKSSIGICHNGHPPGMYEHEILDGPSWLMRWTTWTMLGGLERTCAPGACQSEEYKFCSDLRSDGGRIGVIHPHVVVHTGLTQTDGKLAPGAAERRAMIPEGVLAE
jgi:glycosyltransferase involved in cell wall biosynthesis